MSRVQTHRGNPVTPLHPRVMYRTRSSDGWIETLWRNFPEMCAHYGYAPVEVACQRMMDILGVAEDDYYYDHYGIHLEGRYEIKYLNDNFHRM